MDDLQVRRAAIAWGSAFETALRAGDEDGLTSLFADPAYLRDNGALTWDYRQFHGRDAVVSTLLGVAREIQPHSFRLSEAWPAPSLIGEGDAQTVEAFFDFSTKSGTAVLVLSAVPDEASEDLKARAIFTRLEELDYVQRPTGFPAGLGYEAAHPGQTWKQNREAARDYSDREPEVVVVGAGQAGLTTAACLRRLGVDVLNVDRYEKVGDSWGKRYDSLYLHNPTEMNGFPFLPFPSHYPQYLPKDLIADWLDMYARYMDLTVWTGTEFLSAKYDAAADRWNAVVRRQDGTVRTVHPRHIVWATGGIGGKPHVPSLAGLEKFAGQVMHSSQYTDAADYGIKKAVIIGVATSAHDIARNLHAGGVQVTMFQRGPVVVNNVDTANLAYAGYLDPTITTELVDLRYGIGLINPLREKASQDYHAMAQEIDRELLDRLREAGLELGHGVNGQGWLDLFLRTGGGYYLNTGTSELIADGEVKIEQFVRVAEFISNGVKLDDGTIVEAELIVLATGYQSRKSEVVDAFGEDVGERVGEIARLDPEGEWANMWGQTAQRGLWFNGGGINQMRPGSQRLAMLIKADLDGRIPESFRRKPRQAAERLLAAAE